MQQPKSLFAQYEGKAAAEFWRGSGVWPLQEHACELEPPWEAFDRRAVTAWDCFFNDWEGPWVDGGLFGRRVSLVHPLNAPLVLPKAAWALDEENCYFDQLIPIVVEQFAEDETTVAKAQHLLLSLSSLHRPAAFEVIGLGPQPTYGTDDPQEIYAARRDKVTPSGWTEPTIRLQFVAHRRDAPQVEHQLGANYPNSSVVMGVELDDGVGLIPATDLLSDNGFAYSMRLGNGYCFPLKTFSRLEVDPLGAAIAVMEHLGRREWAMLQVLFQPARQPWADTLWEAVRDPYKDDLLFNDISERLLADKFSSPLFAVSIRLAASKQQHLRQLRAWTDQFAAPPQEIVPITDDEYSGDLSWSLMGHCTFLPGCLLNTQELAGLVHLPGPNVVSERLPRVVSRTKPAVETAAEPGSVVLGENVHRGQAQLARIPAELRPLHCYVAGATGTGKSTLLLNMACQDIAAGAGVAVLDPHGDLVTELLARIPPHRQADLIYFNAADADYPPALNILESSTPQERQTLVPQTVAAFRRHFSDSSWGPRLEHILTYALDTTMAFTGGTLYDVRRLLTDPAFRARNVAKLRDPGLVSFWNQEFPNMARNSLDSVLNKFTPFLRNTAVRNIICQRSSPLNFDAILNDRKILLVNLSFGMLSESVAGVLGMFLVAKLLNATFRRAAIPKEKRRPFYLYVDEFQNFMHLSKSFDRILSEARKYGLVLAGMANQYVAQLHPAVRAAIFGNVGTLVSFRLGVDDANLITKDFGAFKAEEVLSLSIGQALVRLGTSQNSFNITTFRESPRLDPDPTAELVAASRKQYATPRRQVEAMFAAKPSPPPTKPRRSSTSAKPPPAPDKDKSPAPPSADGLEDFVS